jgi:hypothetical protein
MKKTALFYLVMSSLLSVNATASEQCPEQFAEFATSQFYAAFFEALSNGPIYRPERQPEGLVGDPIYPELFGRWVPASYLTQSLVDRAWGSWSRRDWDLVLNELRQARPVVADDYGVQQVGQLEQKIKGVECYANSRSGST